MFRADASSFTGIGFERGHVPAELADGGAEPDRRVAARAADLEHLAAGTPGGKRVEERAARRRHLERALRDGKVASLLAGGLLLQAAQDGADVVVEHQRLRSLSTASRTQQSARWSFTTPHACMPA